MIRSANPYLSFPGNTEEAFDHYRSIFGGEFVSVVRFRDLEGDRMGIPEEELDRIAHVALLLGEGNVLMGTDVVGAWKDGFAMGTNSYIHLEVASGDEAGRAFGALSNGGRVEIPLTCPFRDAGDSSPEQGG